MKTSPANQEDKGTGFVLPGFCVGYSFPYCQHGTLDQFKDLYPARIDLQADQVVEVEFSAFARGEFLYSLTAEPICSAVELMSSRRALSTPWAEVEPGAVDAGPWYVMYTATVFSVKAQGTYTFAPRLAKSVFSGKYAVHHQNIVVRLLGKGPVRIIQGPWPSQRASE